MKKVILKWRMILKLKTERQTDQDFPEGRAVKGRTEQVRGDDIRLFVDLMNKQGIPDDKIQDMIKEIIHFLYSIS